MNLAQATAQCPYCDVKKHQIDGTPERAADVASKAIRKHIHEDHPDRSHEWAPMDADGDR